MRKKNEIKIENNKKVTGVFRIETLEDEMKTDTRKKCVIEGSDSDKKKKIRQMTTIIEKQELFSFPSTDLFIINERGM